jgi:hypothetical protein
VEEEALVPGNNFNVLVPVMAGCTALVNLTVLGKELSSHKLVAKEAGVVGTISVVSGPREWSPKAKWPEGFVEIAKLRTYSESEFEMKEFENGYVYAVIGFIPDSSPFRKSEIA